MTPAEAIAIVRSKSRGRTVVDGEKPRLDEVLVETIDRLVEALQELCDWQNGPPLLSPKWKDGWEGAMQKAEVILSELQGAFHATAE